MPQRRNKFIKINGKCETMNTEVSTLSPEVTIIRDTEIHRTAHPWWADILSGKQNSYNPPLAVDNFDNYRNHIKLQLCLICHQEQTILSNFSAGISRPLPLHKSRQGMQRITLFHQTEADLSKPLTGKPSYQKKKKKKKKSANWTLTNHSRQTKIDRD